MGVASDESAEMKAFGCHRTRVYMSDRGIPQRRIGRVLEELAGSPLPRRNRHRRTTIKSNGRVPTSGRKTNRLRMAQIQVGRDHLLRRAVSAFFVLGTVGVLFAACGGASPSGVASIGSSTSSTSPSSAPTGNSGAPISPTMAKAQLAYSVCMRGHGVPNYPDPNPGGGWSRSEFRTIDQNSSAYLAATKHCAYLDKSAGLTPWSKSQLAKHVAAALKVSACMRAHGISNFPEPNALGGFLFSPSISNEPGYAAAAKACGGPPAEGAGS